MQRFLAASALLLACTLALPAATITSTTGKPQVLRSLDHEWRTAATGTALAADDRVRCGAGVTAEIRTNDGHRIKLWPRSEISLEKVDGAETRFSLAMGRLRSWVKKLRPREKFEIKTPVAVCSVRGTDFSVEYGQDKQARVEVYEGQVAAREEKTGGEVLVGRGEYTRIQENKPPEEPKNLPDEKNTGDESARPVLNETKEEARAEIFQEISREAVLSRAADEIKLAEYQNGKAVVDVTGNRVRMEEYIVRTQPKEFKYVVLNTRQDRFDFGKIIFTFNDTLPGDLTLATRNMFYSEGAAKPAWYLTDVLSVMSNTVDQVNEEVHGGNMFVDNPARPTSWSQGFGSYTFSVNNKTWWAFTDANNNGRYDAGEISYYNIATGNKLSFAADFQYDAALGKYYYTDADSRKVYFSEFSQPGGPDTFHFFQKNNYADGQWIAAGDYVIDDNGKVLTLADLKDATSQEMKQKAYESNFERVYTSSVFNGRKIDLVFSAKLLLDAGILSLPNPQTLNQ